MGYRSLVMAKVRKAFEAVGDLVYDVTLIQSDTTGFNFTSLTANKSSLSTTVVKALFVEKTKKGSDSNVRTGKLTFITEDVNDLSQYDRVLIKAVEWKIVEPVTDDDYLTTATVTRSLSG